MVTNGHGNPVAEVPTIPGQVATIQGHGFDGSPITVIIEHEDEDEDSTEHVQQEMLTEHAPEYVQMPMFTEHAQAHVQTGFPQNSIAAELQQAITEHVPLEVVSEHAPQNTQFVLQKVTVLHPSQAEAIAHAPQNVATEHAPQEVTTAHAPEHVQKKKPRRPKKKISSELESISGLIQDAFTGNSPVEIPAPRREVRPNRPMSIEQVRPARPISIEHRMTDMRASVKQAEERMSAPTGSSDLETLTRLLGEPMAVSDTSQTREETKQQGEPQDMLEQYLLGV